MFGAAQSFIRANTVMHTKTMQLIGAEKRIVKAQSRPQNRNVPEHPDSRHTDHRENYLPSTSQQIVLSRKEFYWMGESLATLATIGSGWGN
jgi:hypothetical protein